MATALRGVDVATVSLLSVRAGAPGDEPDPNWLDGHGSNRQRVHQATGMLIAQLGVSAEQAFARLRAHAYTDGRSLDEIAADIVERRLRLDPTRPNPTRPDTRHRPANRRHRPVRGVKSPAAAPR